MSDATKNNPIKNAPESMGTVSTTTKPKNSTAKRLYRVQTDFDFTKMWRRMLLVSAVALVVSVGLLAVRGVNLSIDFRGGAIFEVPSEHMTQDDAEAVLAEFDKVGGSKIQTVTDSEGTTILRIQAEDAKDVNESTEIREALANAANEAAPDDAQIEVGDVGVNTVGPSWGEALTRDAARALVVFLIVIALYLTWTLEWRMALAAIVSVAHDVLITLGIYALFRFEVTPATVISVLTILGFSLYDTIVVYDRVKENAARYDPQARYTFNAIMRRSLNQVLMRSVNTSIVAILPPTAIFLLGGLVYGQPTMMDFSLALMIGLAIGVYSSIGVAAPVLVWLKEFEPGYSKVRARARAKGPEAEAAADHIEIVDAWVVGVQPAAPVGASRSARANAGVATTPTASTKAGAPTEAESAAKYSREVPPRPRKQGKKR